MKIQSISKIIRNTFTTGHFVLCRGGDFCIMHYFGMFFVGLEVINCPLSVLEVSLYTVLVLMCLYNNTHIGHVP